ncbi:MAG: FxDxF family PEP-CTERM protein [Proteobacteria bacterium]|nr:FxDxF family PEP-CTERM protein [Pseudomonadota bacterium]
MKNKNLRYWAIAGLLSCTSMTAQAAPVDLSGWTELTLNYPGGQGAGNWVLEPGDTAVEQKLNADPSFFLNNQNLSSYTVDGTWQVKPSGDDDYMGFAFGYQNSSNFYLFDWKKASQGYVGRTAAEGMTIKKFEGATGDGLADLSLAEFWENQVDFGDMSVLATNHSSTKGWVDNVLYTFHLEYNVNPGEIHIVINQGATELWNVTVLDSTFTSGQFGFYNNSQSNVRYAGFEVTPVPEPETYAMLLAGLVLTGFMARRRKATEV